MKSISLLASLAALSALCLSISCSSKSDGGNGAAGSSAGGNPGGGGNAPTGGSSGEAGSRSSGDAGESNLGNAGESNLGSAGDGAGGDGAVGGLNACSTGKLFAGDPLYNDKTEVPGPKPAGQGLLDDPPIRNEAIAVIGTRVFVETEQEIWSTDTADPAGKITRIAGQEDAGVVNAGVACKDTRFLVIRDMTATADGKLVVIDYVGGAVIEISNPGTATCKSDWVAGTHAMTADPGSDYPLAQGDKDGPGAQALFGGDKAVTGIGGGGIHKVTVDPAGNIYTYDEGTGKFKKIATDAARTVSTIGVGATDDNIMGLAFLKGKLYATGVDGSNDFMKEIDPAAYNAAKPKANVKDVFRSRGDQFSEIAGTGAQAIPAQIISDGEALIVSGQSGYVWRVGTDGTVLATLAGSGAYLDYKDDFDPLVPHAGTAWQLVSSLSNPDGGPWLAFDQGKLYWSGGIGIGKYMLQFSCP